MGTASDSSRRLRNVGGVLFAALFVLLEGCRSSSSPAPKPPTPPPQPPADQQRRESPWSISCDDAGYVIRKDGRALIEVSKPGRDDPTPYAFCVVPATSGSPTCEPLTRRRWQAEVRSGDRLVLTDDPGGAIAAPAGLHARLCPTDEPLPFVEWSSEAVTYSHTAERPPADVQIWVEVGP